MNSIRPTYTTPALIPQFATTAELTQAFYRHIKSTAVKDPMDQEEEDAEIDDDEY